MNGTNNNDFDQERRPRVVGAEAAILLLITVFGLVGGVVVFYLEVPATVAIVFLACGVAALVYGFLGGIPADGDVLRSLSKKKMYGSPNSNPSPELGADKENHTSWERYYQVSDCSSSLRNDWYSGI